LDTAHRFEGNTLASGIFVNDGGGRCSFVELPRIAQAFSVSGIAIHDFTNDDRLDIYIVGNSSSPQRETGNMDGGVSLLLKGDVLVGAVVPFGLMSPASSCPGMPETSH